MNRSLCCSRAGAAPWHPTMSLHMQLITMNKSRLWRNFRTNSPWFYQAWLRLARIPTLVNRVRMEGMKSQSIANEARQRKVKIVSKCLKTIRWLALTQAKLSHYFTVGQQAISLGRVTCVRSQWALLMETPSLITIACSSRASSHLRTIVPGRLLITVPLRQNTRSQPRCTPYGKQSNNKLAVMGDKRSGREARRGQGRLARLAAITLAPTLVSKRWLLGRRESKI